MVPNLDFIRTMLNGVMKSLLAGIDNTKSVLERKIAEVDEKIHTPDFAAEEGQSGFIKNKPTLVGRPGTGENAEVFNIKENIASGPYSHAECYATTASAYYSHAEGLGTIASGTYSHAEGCGTIADGPAQHAQGRYNVEDTDGKYAHIVGNGNVITKERSNAHTLDWDGNAWFAGTLEGTALILKSSGGKRFKITVDDNGTLKTAQLA